MYDVELVREILRQVHGATQTIANRFAPIATPEDFVSLASAMERILSDENLASRLSEAGYQSAQVKFSQEAFLQKYLEVLEWIQRIQYIPR